VFKVFNKGTQQWLVFHIAKIDVQLPDFGFVIDLWTHPARGQATNTHTSSTTDASMYLPFCLLSWPTYWRRPASKIQKQFESRIQGCQHKQFMHNKLDSLEWKRRCVWGGGV